MVIPSPTRSLPFFSASIAFKLFILQIIDFGQFLLIRPAMSRISLFDSVCAFNDHYHNLARYYPSRLYFASQDEGRNIIHRSAGQVMRVFLCAVHQQYLQLLQQSEEKRDLAILNHSLFYSLLPFPKVHDDDEGEVLSL